MVFRKRNRCCVGLVVFVCCALGDGGAFAQVIPPGVDLFETPDGSTRVEFGGTSQVPPIPADFFFPGSLPWSGVIELQGQPLAAYPGARVSAMIERKEAADVGLGTPATVPVELLSLSLKSVAPITVHGLGARAVDSFFDVFVELTPGVPSTGFMTIQETMPGVGGTFSFNAAEGGGIYVYARFNFFEAWPSNRVVKVLDSASPILLESDPAQPPVWQYAPPPLAVAAGNDFYPAVDSFFDVLLDGGSSGIHVVSAATQVVIPIGNDYFKTRAGSTRVEFGGTSQIPPIPADFFCPGSPPWEGVIELQEEPIDAYALPVSTVAKKKQAATMPGPATIEVELVELSLKNVAPITVPCPSGDSFFDVFVTLNPNQPSTGLMTITETTPGVGGQFSFNAASGGGIYVYARFNFFEAWPARGAGPFRAIPPIIWDPLDPVLLESDPASPPIWQYDEPEAVVEAGHNFYPAVDSFFDITFDGGLSGQHGVTAPPPAPPPDYHASPPNLSWVIFDPTGDVPPIPADFFGPGSDPFVGQVDLEGDPIDQATLGDTSTILQRTADPVAPGDPVGAGGTVDIELVELSLRSTQPITVTYNGGMTPEEWNVHVGLSPTPAPVGSLSATKTHANGGTYDVTIHVQPILTFTRVTDGAITTIDTALQGEAPYELQGSGHFVHAVDSFFDVYYDPAAQWVGGINETIPGDTTSQIAEQISVEPPNGLQWLVHGIVPPPPPPQYCPVPVPPDDWCQPLQTRDCLTTSSTTTCLAQTVQIDGVETPVVETCNCFEPGGCGAVQITPVVPDFVLSCPGSCPTPEICQIHLDGQPSGQTSVNASAVAGAVVTCGCAGPPVCEPNVDGSACTQGGCSAIPEDRCLSTCMNFDPATGATRVTSCDCMNGIGPVDCHVEPSPTVSPPICVGDCPTGTVCERTETTNPDGTIDVCCNCVLLPTVGDPGVAPYPHDRRKNRYISFDPNKAENDGKNVAFKVELKQLTLGSCDGNGGFCREDREACSVSGTTCTIDLDCPLFPVETCSVWTDCNSCSAVGNPCINQAIDCAPTPPQTCDPNGQQCVNDAPDVGGTSVGHVWWVGPECPTGTGSHLMVSEPFRKVSTNWPNPTHVGDCEIVPEAVYGVRTVDVTTSAESGELLTETTRFASISASWWGDCVGPLKKFCGGDIRTPECTGDADCTAPQTCDRAWTLPDGSANFDDVNAALALVAPGAMSVPPHITWVDLHGNCTGTPGSQNFDPPNWIANFSDIGQIMSGFGGFPYKGYDPADCPDTNECCSP